VPTVRELFETLSPPTHDPGGPPQFSAHPIPGFESHRIGKTLGGVPCLLLHVVGGDSSPTPPPILLSHVAVQHDVHCRISRQHQPIEEAAFTLVRCLSQDPALVAQFIDVIELVVRAAGATPTVSHVRQAVEQLAELFRALDRPARKSAQGVWGELFLIAAAQHPERLAAAWRISPAEVFDFSEGRDRIEVKAASGRVREHYFSLAQVHPSPGVRVLIASLFVDGLTGGVSLKSLLARTRQRVAARPELALRVETVTAQSLGRSWALAIEESFDWQRAESSLRFFPADAIPTVPAELPREVTDVRFRSDVSGVPTLGAVDARQKGGLFEAL
jgi:hypothetical protein